MSPQSEGWRLLANARILLAAGALFTFGALQTILVQEPSLTRVDTISIVSLVCGLLLVTSVGSHANRERQRIRKELPPTTLIIEPGLAKQMMMSGPFVVFIFGCVGTLRVTGGREFGVGPKGVLILVNFLFVAIPTIGTLRSRYNFLAVGESMTIGRGPGRSEEISWGEIRALKLLQIAPHIGQLRVSLKESSQYFASRSASARASYRVASLLGIDADITVNLSDFKGPPDQIYLVIATFPNLPADVVISGHARSRPAAPGEWPR